MKFEPRKPVVIKRCEKHSNTKKCHPEVSRKKKCRSQGFWEAGKIAIPRQESSESKKSSPGVSRRLFVEAKKNPKSQEKTQNTPEELKKNSAQNTPEHRGGPKSQQMR